MAPPDFFPVEILGVVDFLLPPDGFEGFMEGGVVFESPECPLPLLPDLIEGLVPFDFRLPVSFFRLTSVLFL